MAIIRAILGFLNIIVYMIFETMLFALPLWFVWNISLPLIFLSIINPITYIQSWGLIMTYKIITFDVVKLSESGSKTVLIDSNQLIKKDETKKQSV